MSKELKAKYLRIYETTLSVYDFEPNTSLYDFVVKDAHITFDDCGIIKISGQKIEWNFLFYSEFVEDMKRKPHEDYVKMGYKSIFDFFKGIKKPYVKSGWYKLKETKPFQQVMSNWILIL